MLKGLMQWMKDERYQAECNGWTVQMFSRHDCVIVVTTTKSSVFIRCIIRKPLKGINQMIELEELMKAYPTRGKKLYSCFHNFSFA